MRSRLLLALGAILIVIGIYLAVRPLAGWGPVTGSRFMDMAFAVFFLIRGVMNVRVARRTAPAIHPPTSSSGLPR